MPLGFLAGETSSRALAVSDDGSTVVGFSGFRAFRWTADSGMVELGELPGGSSSHWAVAVSENGSVIVGSCSAAGRRRAFIWDESNGMRELQSILVGLGIDLSGWTLEAATDVSADGRTIVGGGQNPNGQTEAWIAFLGDPLPPPCPGDVNGDRVIDLSDLATLLAHFGAPSGATPADGDLDGDTDVDLSDLTVLLANFGATCS
jgi:hypothetical protein